MQKSLIDKIREKGKFSGLSEIFSSQKKTALKGVTDSRLALLSLIAVKEKKLPSLIVTPTYRSAMKVAGDLECLTDIPVFLMPETEVYKKAYDARSREELILRLSGLRALTGKKSAVIVASAAEAVLPLIPADEFLGQNIEIKKGQKMEPDNLVEKFIDLGYQRESSVYAPGQFSKRGDIIDIFSPTDELPTRIEFFDIEIDTIRKFDASTQRSVKNIENTVIFPAGIFNPSKELAEIGIKKIEESDFSNTETIKNALEFRNNPNLLADLIPLFYDNPARLWDYIYAGGKLIVYEPKRCLEVLETKIEEELIWKENVMPLVDDVCESFRNLDKREEIITMSLFGDDFAGKEELEINCVQTVNFNGKMDLLERELRKADCSGYEVFVLASTNQRRENLTEFVERLELLNTVKVEEGALSEGMMFPDEKLLIITDKDIFGIAKKRRHKREHKKDKIQSFIDLRPGDYVVHDMEGIGRFESAVQMEVDGERKDYLKIVYQGDDVLYVPVEQMHFLQKYSSSDSVMPRLSKMGGTEWKKTKEKAKTGIMEMARELINLSAVRKVNKGYAFPPDTIWQKEFEDSFIYEETEDQLLAVSEIKKDMEKDEIMDRLLLGDVGYGKTEVAMRAIFKCVNSGKQSALLVPTTLLAKQHFDTFTDRFKEYPVNIEMLSRFRTNREQTEIKKRLEKGEVDVIIGTHGLLSKKLKFKDLGFLVVDEEQHFGVKHKEIIKQIKKNVDVLTLSATPIPRTLHMSLTGIRDISLIEEPPEDRYPVRTYVMEQNDFVIKEAIAREVERGGQVYVVYNRVRGIRQIAEKIQNLLPDISIGVGHGQMKEETLENVMTDFVYGNYDVLLSTTIIESGIDIKNANTIIVLNSDHFGLSQLYQLRGRVGRSDRIAYAYLFYQKDKSLTEAAMKRLKAIREFTEFGAGFKIAIRDLEIRGAGNLLGSEQHGHMQSVGYELYCRLVDDAVKELSGDSRDVEKKTEAQVDIGSGYIPERYIEDEIKRLEMYKKISKISNRLESDELLDEIIDRYGEPPSPVVKLLKIALIRALAEKNGISMINRQSGFIVFYLDMQREINTKALVELVGNYESRLFVHGGEKPYLRLNPAKNDYIEEILEFLTNLGSRDIIH